MFGTEKTRSFCRARHSLHAAALRLGSAGLAVRTAMTRRLDHGWRDQGTGRTNFQVPEEMRNMAERSLTQARQAMDNFLGAARRTAETVEQTTDKVQAGAKDYGPEELVSGGAKPPRLP